MNISQIPANGGELSNQSIAARRSPKTSNEVCCRLVFGGQRKVARLVGVRLFFFVSFFGSGRCPSSCTEAYVDLYVRKDEFGLRLEGKSSNNKGGKKTHFWLITSNPLFSPALSLSTPPPPKSKGRTGNQNGGRSKEIIPKRGRI